MVSLVSIAAHATLTDPCGDPVVLSLHSRHKLVLMVSLVSIAVLLFAVPVTMKVLGVQGMDNSTDAGASAAAAVESPCDSHSACFWLTLVLRLLYTACTVFLPAIVNAITLGLVGPLQLPRQVPENEMAMHAGAVLMVIIAGTVAYYARFPDIVFYLPAVSGTVLHLHCRYSSSSLSPCCHSSLLVPFPPPPPPCRVTPPPMRINVL